MTGSLAEARAEACKPPAKRIPSSFSTGWRTRMSRAFGLKGVRACLFAGLQHPAHGRHASDMKRAVGDYAVRHSEERAACDEQNSRRTTSGTACVSSAGDCPDGCDQQYRHQHTGWLLFISARGTGTFFTFGADRNACATEAPSPRPHGKANSAQHHQPLASWRQTKGDLIPVPGARERG